MLRADAGLTVGDVARGLEVSRRQVRRWETGRESVPEGARRAVADVLGVPVADLVPTREQSQVKVEASALRVGAVERPIPAADPEAVLPGYLEMVYKLRGLEPGAPLPLRDEDLDALAVALGSDPDVIEERLLALITCSDEEAARLRALILRRRVASSAAGLAAGALALSGMSFDELFEDPPNSDDRVEIVTEAGDDEPVATVGSSTTVAPPAAVGEPGPAPAPADTSTTEPTVDIGEPLVIERPPPGSESEPQEPEVGEGRTIERDPPGSATTEPEPEPTTTSTTTSTTTTSTTAPPEDPAPDA